MATNFVGGVDETRQLIELEGSSGGGDNMGPLTPNGAVVDD